MTDAEDAPVADIPPDIIFGVACFNFGWRRPTPFEFNPSEYFSAVKDALSTIPTIDNVTIDEGEPAPPTMVEMPFEDISDEPFSLPLGNFWEIEFNVHLPVRIQKEFLSSFESTGTEDFLVTIKSAYYCPVTFIAPIGSESESPSHSVIVLREYLRREFSSRPDSQVTFEVLGPSPFHLDCFIKSAPSQAPIPESGWTCQVTRLGGYDKAVFVYDPTKYSDAVELVYDIYHEVAEELASYYYIQQLQLGKAREWRAVRNTIDVVTKVYQKKGAMGWAYRLIKSSRHLDEGFINLAQYEMLALGMAAEIAEAVRETYTSGQTTHFKHFIDTLMEEDVAAPTSQAASLLQLLDRRRARRVEAAALVFASLLGGAVGAVVTGYVARGH